MNKSLGYSQEDATSLAESLVARPGFSEHETGLALDINLDAGGNNEDVYHWLANNSYKYGFVIRYPEGKTIYIIIKFYLYENLCKTLYLLYLCNYMYI